METIEKEALGTLFENQLISLEEVYTWSTEALKYYCRKRACNVTRPRSELCARVYFMYNTKVPEHPTLKEKEISKKADYKALLNAGTKSTDPNKSVSFSVLFVHW